MPKFIRGDYVFATKYHDGDAGDHWCVGFYDHEMTQYNPSRHHIVDADGQPFRGNGFRRVTKITAEVGKMLLEICPRLEFLDPSRSLYGVLRKVKQDLKERNNREKSK